MLASSNICRLNGSKWGLFGAETQCKMKGNPDAQALNLHKRLESERIAQLAPNLDLKESCGKLRPCF